MNRAAPCLTPSPPQPPLCHLSESRSTATRAAAAASNHSALSVACSWGGGTAVATRGNGQIRTFCFTHKARRRWTAEWAKVIQKKEFF